MKARLLIASGIIAAAIAGCKHDTFKPIGGKGGAASLTIYPQHHGVANTLDSMMVYIKYNTADKPADGKYDDSATCTITNMQPSCTFSSLWNGNYYIYGTGIDYSYPGQRMKGGISYTIKAQQATTIMLPVGEE
jgi:hypothetical protein